MPQSTAKDKIEQHSNTDQSKGNYDVKYNCAAFGELGVKPVQRGVNI